MLRAQLCVYEFLCYPPPCCANCVRLCKYIFSRTQDVLRKSECTQYSPGGSNLLTKIGSACRAHPVSTLRHTVYFALSPPLVQTPYSCTPPAYLPVLLRDDYHIDISTDLDCKPTGNWKCRLERSCIHHLRSAGCKPLYALACHVDTHMRVPSFLDGYFISYCTCSRTGWGQG